MESKKIEWLFLAIGFLLGLVLGMIFQQMIFTASAVEFGESLEGTTFNLEIDINETQLIEGFNETTQEIVKAIKENKTYGV